MTKINAALDRFGAKITSAVGTMWCAILFALLALTSLSSSLGSVKDFVQWLSTTFLQLTLLSIIMVGQRVQGDQTREHVAAHAKLSRAHLSVELVRQDKRLKPAPRRVAKPKGE